MTDTSQTPFQRASNAPPLPNKTFAFVLYCLKRFRGLLLLMWLMETCQAAGSILVPYAIKALMDAIAVLQPSPETLWQVLQAPLLLLVGLNVGEVIFSRASGALLIVIGPRLRQQTSRLLYAYLQQHAPRYFAGHFSGSLAHRISETAMSVNHTTWSLLCEFWPISVTFTVSVALLLNVHLELGGFVGGWMLLYILISFWLATRCQPYAKNYAATRSLVNGKIVDSVTNMLNSKLFARLDYERDYLESYLETEVKEGRKTFWYMERVRWFQFTAAAILKIGTIAYALMLWNNDAISVGDFAMATGLALLIIGDARNLTRRFLEFFEYIGNIANGVDTIIQAHEIVDQPNASDLQVTQGKIEFRDVCFAYDAGRPIFHNLNVTIQAGQRVGLVGFSGSGKSTFVNLILRSYEPQQGHICIDDQDIVQATQESLHRQVSLIPQDPSLFHRSLKENIAYGKLDATDANIQTAATFAHAHEFIHEMPEGYESLVGERGVKLSGGQRQRIAIARVMLKDAPILILDEATASLDSVTEQTIQENLDRIVGKKTVIAIAHRLSTIAHLDRILVFKAGQIVEDGTHEQLLAAKGNYYQLWNMQAGGFLPE